MNIIILSIFIAIATIVVSFRYVTAKTRQVDKQLNRPDLIELCEEDLNDR
ncbi:hypothetical protein HF847_04960 [Clostridium cochlearium]|uniref:Uncharacterized protein n=1 Tax=Clostridium cochlearium TaxID=1494 RepID=A0A2X2W6Z2_CLOCO|nr:hypothetical protein [Clostridium cochlearium]NME95343.1 hypothetical protein [Clostridium cochlearium]SQB33413.1 Uncharacterised protein [Clostridium cochlearium]